jgi:hypothetical protein
MRATRLRGTTHAAKSLKEKGKMDTAPGSEKEDRQEQGELD